MWAGNHLSSGVRGLYTFCAKGQMTNTSGFEGCVSAVVTQLCRFPAEAALKKCKCVGVTGCPGNLTYGTEIWVPPHFNMSWHIFLFSVLSMTWTCKSHFPHHTGASFWPGLAPDYNLPPPGLLQGPYFYLQTGDQRGVTGLRSHFQHQGPFSSSDQSCSSHCFPFFIECAGVTLVKKPVQVSGAQFHHTCHLF